MNNVFVTLPPNFVALKYAGYFFNLDDQQLYSIKSGNLRPLTKVRQTIHSNYLDGYLISVNGKSIQISMSFLRKLIPTPVMIPVAV